MGDVIVFPQGRRSVARREEPPSAVGAALHAVRADTGEEWLDRLSTAIALGPPWDSADGPLCDVVSISDRCG
jgi:hypothetical protein